MASLFGRAWNIQVLTPSDQPNQQTLLTVSSSDKETQSLRVMFDVQQYKGALFSAELKIYNPNFQTIQAIPEGSIVSIAAGYQSEGAPTEIFRGPVYQALWGKEDPVTTVLTLLCFLGIQELTENVIAMTIGPLATQREIVIKMAENLSLPVSYVAPESEFPAKTLPRSSTVFGTPQKIFGQIASRNDMAFSLGPSGIFLAGIVENKSPDYVYAPPLQQQQKAETGVSYRLIGTPEQTQYGVNFRVLLDSKLLVKWPALQVQIKNAVINQLPLAIDPEQGIQANPSFLTQDGVYAVGGIRHIGDTRGNSWETQVTGISIAGSALAVPGGAVH